MLFKFLNYYYLELNSSSAAPYHCTEEDSGKHSVVIEIKYWETP